MSVRVRLTRVGSKKNPIWRVVVADQRSARDGRFIETIGHYNPQTEPSTIVIDRERLDHWIARGAQPSGTVKQLVKAQSKAPPEPPPSPEPAAAPAPEAEAEPASEVEAPTVPEPEAVAADPDAVALEPEVAGVEPDSPPEEENPS